MRRILALLLTAALSGCSFTLGMVNLPPGTTQAQRDTAILVCKDRANQQNAESGKAAAEFALGASLIGFPAGVQMEIDAKREAFTKCMNARGYLVRPPGATLPKG